MQSSNLRLRPIQELLVDAVRGQPVEYWIPAYQRGYRWSPHQVTQLLDDIWEFVLASENGRREQFYCLQPLVVQPRADDKIEVVDGQQRLTTIFIILTCLREVAPFLVKDIFRLTFETRGAANEPFLQKIDLSREQENIDFYHICQAYKAVENWRAEHPAMQQLKLLQALLNDDITGKNVKVIWFELAPSDNVIDAFTRLNVGKIPLTDDELIRALFLRKSSDATADHDTQVQIANEWDQIEKRLQDDSFWYFLTPEHRSHNRIYFLFKLIAEGDGLPPEARQDQNPIFYAFQARMKGKEIKEEWGRIKEEFMRLQEWYEDETRVLYHVVGFLVTRGMSLTAIRQLSDQASKSGLDRRLRQEAFRRVIGEWPEGGLDAEQIRTQVEQVLAELEYGDGEDHRIRAILLLFNLATLLLNPKSNLRFQFSNYKKDSWDLEHVRSVAPDRLTNYEARIDWLRACIGYLEASKLEPGVQAEINRVMALPRKDVNNETIFDGVYAQVLQALGESPAEAADNSIGNLTLLDAGTNRSYKNAPFGIKRKILLEEDESGTYVPLCTRNVFLKCYSPEVSNALIWSSADKQGYYRAIAATLVAFFLAAREA